MPCMFSLNRSCVTDNTTIVRPTTVHQMCWSLYLRPLEKLLCGTTTATAMQATTSSYGAHLHIAQQQCAARGIQLAQARFVGHDGLQSALRLQLQVHDRSINQLDCGQNTLHDWGNLALPVWQSFAVESGLRAATASPPALQ
jgi:hypothetical protein